MTFLVLTVGGTKSFGFPFFLFLKIPQKYDKYKKTTGICYYHQKTKKRETSLFHSPPLALFFQSRVEHGTLLVLSFLYPKTCNPARRKESISQKVKLFPKTCNSRSIKHPSRRARRPATVD